MTGKDEPFFTFINDADPECVNFLDRDELSDKELVSTLSKQRSKGDTMLNIV